jgi:hypothetical protein
MVKKPVLYWIKENASFISILLIGLLLRSLFIEFQGLSNDELSAWYRTQYADWNSLLYYGVKSGDMHPAFYQVFLWAWVRVFGDSEWALRSTGLLFYILNSFLIYAIGKRFFSQLSSLLLIALYAGLSFTVINTVIARPYNSGTFFLLLTFWSILEINRSQLKWNFWQLGLIVGLSGSMLSHYFAFLSAAIMAGFGLVYVKKERRLDIVLTGVIACLIFLPHLSITLFQLAKGGLGWLSKPKIDWLPQFFVEFFNHSVSFTLIFVGIVGVLLFLSRRKNGTREERFVLVFSVTTYIVAHIISLLYTPILREIVMLFILPFLFLGLFSRIVLPPTKWITGGLIFLTLALGVHSVTKGNLLEPENYGVFREVGMDLTETRDKLGIEHIEVASNFNNTAYLNYYLSNAVKSEITDWASSETVYQLAELAKKSHKTYFAYCWSNNYHVPMYLEVIKDSYPRIQEENNYFNSGFWCFKKGNSTENKIEIKAVNWEGSRGQFNQEFFGSMSIPVSDLFSSFKRGSYVLATTRGLATEQSPLHWVATIERDGAMLMEGDSPKVYTAFDQVRLYGVSDTSSFKLAIKLPPDLKQNDVLKCYFWNPEKKDIYIEKPRVYIIFPRSVEVSKHPR